MSPENQLMGPLLPFTTQTSHRFLQLSKLTINTKQTMISYSRPQILTTVQNSIQKPQFTSASANLNATSIIPPS